MSKKNLKGIIHLTAYDMDGGQVLEAFLSAREFSEQTHPALDDAGFRKTTRIARLIGQMHDADGVVSQEFVVCFDDAGCCVGDAARFADGTVAGEWERLQSADLRA